MAIANSLHSHVQLSRLYGMMWDDVGSCPLAYHMLEAIGALVACNHFVTVCWGLVTTLCHSVLGF